MYGQEEASNTRNRHPLSSLEPLEPVIPRLFLEHDGIFVVGARSVFPELAHLVAKRVPHHAFFQFTSPTVLRENLWEICVVFRDDRPNGKEERIQEGMEGVGGVWRL